MRRQTTPTTSVLVAIGVALHVGTVYAQTECPQPTSPDHARQLAARAFDEAEGLFERHDCRAVARFQCSFQLYPHANTLFNIGRSAELCGQIELATRSYRSFVDVYPDDAGRPEVEARLQAMAAAAAPAPNAEPPAPRAAVDPEPQRARPEPMPAAGSRTEPEPSRSPEPGRARSSVPRVLGWVGIGLGGALTITGVGLVGGAYARRNEIDDLEERDPRPTNLDVMAEEGRSLEVSGWVLFGIGVAVLAAGVVLAVLARRGSWYTQTDRAHEASGAPWMLSLAGAGQASSW